MRHLGAFMSGIAAALFLVGCGVLQPARVVETTLPELSLTAPGRPTLAATPVAVATLVPATTDSPFMESFGYPAPSSTQWYPAPWGNAFGRYPAPMIDPTLAIVQMTGPGEPWTDCTVLGGWIGCNQQAQAIPGRVAFSFLNWPAVVALDLENGQAWFAGGQAQFLEWSPQGDRLLVGLSGDHYWVYDSDGGVVDTFDSPIRPRWQPDNSLGRDGVVRSSEGDEARLESDPGGALKLVIKKQDQAEQSFELESQPTDQLYQLIGWVPETAQILGQVSTASSAAIMRGGRLFTLDSASGARVDLESMAPLGRRSEYDWRPGSATLAFVESGSVESRLPTLAIQDFDSGQIQFPLPEGVEIRGFDWHPSGNRLAFAATPWVQGQGFERPGIYLLNPQTGSVPALTHPPQGAEDLLPRWMPDGETVVFARWYQGGVMEIRMIQVGNGQEWLIAGGLPAPCNNLEIGCEWAAITSK